MTKVINRMILIVAVVIIALSCAVFTDTESVLAASKKPAKVKGVKVKVIKVKGIRATVELRWKKDKKAKKYQIYFINNGMGDQVWGKIKTTKTNKSRVTIPMYAKKSILTFKVRGVNGKNKGKFSKPVKKVRRIRKDIVITV